MEKPIMNRRSTHSLTSQRLPRGQILHRELDYTLYGLFGRQDDPRLWITGLDLEAPQIAAGPFEPHDAVRALRLANLSVPDGCELGPWQHGLGLFDVAPLPGHPHEWHPVEPSWLEPSVTAYEEGDITGSPERICCAPPTTPPPVLWDDEDTEESDWEAPPDLLDFALNPIFAAHPHLRHARVGSLEAAWNGHPDCCMVWAPAGGVGGAIVVADFDFPRGMYLGRPRSVG